METLLVEWFTDSAGSFGIVVGEDEITKERKAYIAPCHGMNESEDIDWIKSNGAKVIPKQLENVLEVLNKKEDSNDN